MKSLLIGIAAWLALAAVATAAEAVRTRFGQLSDGTVVDAVELSNRHGMKARVIAFGAGLQALEVPDRTGRIDDVVLGYTSLAGYVADTSNFGVTVGRYANRIAGGKFSLDGKTYQLPLNDGSNTLHGGLKGFGKALWHIEDVRSGSTASVTLAYVSPDGEQGFPGTLKLALTYSLNDNNELAMSYRATTDRPTVVNLTNHTYFNLAGKADRGILGMRLMLTADKYTPVDASLIPSGEIRSVAGTPFDFRTAHEIGARIRDGSEPQIVPGRGYDHNFVLPDGVTEEPKLAARLEDPVSGRVLEVLTTEPGLQFYSGNFLDGTVIGKGNRVYRQSDGVCFEPQHFPDSPNKPAFPSTRLDPGETYRQSSVFRFSTSSAQGR